MNPRQFLDLVIAPTLRQLATVNVRLDGPAQRALVLGTALTESQLIWLRQTPTGPALGVYQMEPRTHADIWANFLRYKEALAEVVASFVPLAGPMRPPDSELVGNLYYATAMCRIHYWRSPRLHPALDATELADYHKQIYNTVLGKTDTSKSRAHFLRAIEIVNAPAMEG